MREDRQWNVKLNRKQKNRLKIIGITTGSTGALILNHVFNFVTIENIFILIFFVLFLLFLLQDFIYRCLNRICLCIERLVKYREDTKRTSNNSEEDGDCKPYVIKRKSS